MADAANKYPENVAGKFYVDDQCIDCDLCRETAPASFKRNDDGGHTYVYKQPETPEEEAFLQRSDGGMPGRSDWERRRLANSFLQEITEGINPFSVTSVLSC